MHIKVSFLNSRHGNKRNYHDIIFYVGGVQLVGPEQAVTVSMEITIDNSYFGRARKSTDQLLFGAPLLRDSCAGDSAEFLHELRAFCVQRYTKSSLVQRSEKLYCFPVGLSEHYVRRATI